MIQNLIKNWKTTSAGLLMIVGSIIHLVFAIRAGTSNENTWTIAVTAIIGGLGLLVAGDSGTSVQKSDVQTDEGTGYLKKTDGTTPFNPPKTP